MLKVLKSNPRLRIWVTARIKFLARQIDCDPHRSVTDVHPGLTSAFSDKEVLSAFLSGIGSGAVFVQIGANDGVKNDPIHDTARDFPLKGLLVEPQKDVFERLQNNYSHNPKILLENAAIGTQDGTQSLYKVDVNTVRADKLRMRKDYSGVSSFNRESVVSYLAYFTGKDSIFRKSDRYIIEEPVATMTFESLLHKHNISNVDLLIIDTEGFDYEIIRTIDFKKHAPGLIYFEHFHLLSEDRLECWGYLSSLGYKCAVTYKDTIAVRVPGA